MISRKDMTLSLACSLSAAALLPGNDGLCGTTPPSFNVINTDGRSPWVMGGHGPDGITPGSQWLRAPIANAHLPAGTLPFPYCTFPLLVLSASCCRCLLGCEGANVTTCCRAVWELQPVLACLQAQQLCTAADLLRKAACASLSVISVQTKP